MLEKKSKEIKDLDLIAVLLYLQDLLDLEVELLDQLGLRELLDRLDLLELLDRLELPDLLELLDPKVFKV